MVQVDSRIGSVELAPHLIRRGLKVSICRLESADVAFDGYGPNGPGSRIGIEINELTAAPNTVQLVFRGAKRYRLPAARR